jgi:hypothetical protein
MYRLFYVQLHQRPRGKTAFCINHTVDNFQNRIKRFFIKKTEVEEEILSESKGTSRGYSYLFVS